MVSSDSAGGQGGEYWGAAAAGRVLAEGDPGPEQVVLKYMALMAKDGASTVMLADYVRTQVQVVQGQVGGRDGLIPLLNQVPKSELALFGLEMFAII